LFADAVVSIGTDPVEIDPMLREKLKVMFIAKHALGDGSLHEEDGNHALYHHEVKTILTGLFSNLSLADDYDALFERPDVDFIFPLLNRGGFLNSEIFLPLLCHKLGLPYLGASPILRGLSDDKHLSKLVARNRGIPTADWAIYRHCAPVNEKDCPMSERMVIKPNASSASWGVQDAYDWAGVKDAVANIHSEGHDAIVEPFLTGSDVEVPVITIDDDPKVMPMMLFEQTDPAHLRTYWEKRDLVERGHKYQLVDFEDNEFVQPIANMTLNLAQEFLPFDYGRYEFQLDAEKGELNFLEVNLNCNLWSQKVFGRSVLRAGWSQEQLIETICAESLRRQAITSPSR